MEEIKLLCGGEISTKLSHILVTKTNTKTEKTGLCTVHLEQKVPWRIRLAKITFILWRRDGTVRKDNLWVWWMCLNPDIYLLIWALPAVLCIKCTQTDINLIYVLWDLHKIVSRLKLHIWNNLLWIPAWQINLEERVRADYTIVYLEV